MLKLNITETYYLHLFIILINKLVFRNGNYINI